MARGDALLFEHLAVRASQEVYEEILRENPGEYEALWRCSRGSLALAILEEEWAQKLELFDQGVSYARRALEVRHDDEEALYWLAASLGRWAQKEMDSRKALELAGEVRRTAERLLEMNPDHAGAHNVLGMFHFEVLRKSRVERMLGGLLAPSTLRGVTWEEASMHLSRAAALDSQSVLYHRDYAEALLWRGDKPAARRVLDEAILLPLILPTDGKFMREVGELRHRAGMGG